MCLNPNDKNSFGVNTDSNFDFPQNCALGIINTSASNIGSGSTVSNLTSHGSNGFFCSACKPGYAPTYQTFNTNTPTMIVSKCTKIEHCVDTKLDSFNRCTECVKEYAFKWDETNHKQDRTKCVVTQDPNCQAQDETANRCKICKPGFSFNKEMKCEKFSQINCTSGDNETSSMNTKFYEANIEYNMIHLKNA